ncbi:MAG: hypothetical protein M3Q48_14920 [Actinomycetota bacterium]|nr:hypothetical protein [Actinomycetota bacterium]
MPIIAARDLLSVRPPATPPAGVHLVGSRSMTAAVVRSWRWSRTRCSTRRRGGEAWVSR